MANIKKTILKKKIDGTLTDIYTKSSADIIEYTPEGGSTTTVAAALASLATGVSDAYTKDEVDAELTKLYNKIMGFTDADKTINDAYDTLKEVSTYLSNNADAVALITGLASTIGAEADAEKETAATGLIGDIRKLQEEVEKASTGLLARMTAAEGDIDTLQSVVGNDTSGLVKDVADLKAVGSTKVEASTTNGNIKIDDQEVTVYDDSTLAGKVTALEGTVGSTSSGLVKDVADLKAVGATKVEAATTNGYIKVDGTDDAIKVYDDSALAGKLVLGKDSDNKEYATVKAYVEAATTALDVGSKADKVTPVTAGNFAGLDGDGNLTDSGKKASDFVAAETGKRLMTTEEATKLEGITAGATKVEAATTNGYIKVDGTDDAIKVYDDSAIAASKIVESTERVFVSPTEKATIKDYVEYVSTMPDTVNADTLYLVEIS